MNYQTPIMATYRDASGDGLLWGYWGLKHPEFWEFVLIQEQYRKELDKLQLDMEGKSMNNSKITIEQYMSIVRAILNVAGGALVTSGVTSDSTIASITGIVLPLASMAWGWFVHSPIQVVKQAEVIVQKGQNV